MRRLGISFGIATLLAICSPAFLPAADWQTEWEKTLVAAKKEGTVVEIGRASCRERV